MPQPPVMILGCMRSGTTFLADKLCGHPQLLKIGLELSHVWEELTDVSIYGECKAADAADYKPEYTFRFSKYLDQAIRESRSLKRSLMRLKLKMAKNNGRVFYDWNNVIPVLKSTHLLNKVPFVTRVLPGVKVVFIVRDVYAQTASLKRHAEKQLEKGVAIRFPKAESACWSIGDAKPGDTTAIPISDLAKMWLRLNTMALRELSALDGEQVHVIRYEDLVNDQSHSLRKVFDFLQLDKRHRSAEEKVLREQSKIYNTTTSGDVLTKWKDQLTADEQDAIKGVLDAHAEEVAFINGFLG